MPKVNQANLPVSALFGIAKPSGPTSMKLVNELKELVSTSRLFATAGAIENLARMEKGGKGKGSSVSARTRAKMLNVKMGQGGTLDPLADGVLVIGVNKGTKKLSDFLDCVKEYRTTCLLGCETDSYDSEGARVRTAPWQHVTREQVESALEQFRGEIQQTPPIFSALKMNGMPLYDYARKGIPLPRPIEKRTVTVHELEIVEWLGTDHNYRWPEKALSEDEVRALDTALSGTAGKGKGKSPVPNELEAPGASGDPPAEVVQDGKVGGGEAQSGVPTAFVLRMRVSGGTYVRCIAHDVGHAIGSAAHVVTLTRSKQGRFVLADPTNPTITLTDTDGQTATENADERVCIPWSVFKEAAYGAEGGGEKEVDEDGWRKWERAVIENMEIVPEKDVNGSTSRAS